MTETALADLLATDLSGLELAAIMIDGVYFADTLCLVALGIDTTGIKHPLGVVAGSSENTTTVTDLLTGLRDRGLDTTRPVLAVLDGAKALTAAVRAVFDYPVIQRCQEHKIRNVRDYLPQRLRGEVEKRMRPPTGRQQRWRARDYCSSWPRISTRPIRRLRPAYVKGWRRH